MSSNFRMYNVNYVSLIGFSMEILAFLLSFLVLADPLFLYLYIAVAAAGILLCLVGLFIKEHFLKEYLGFSIAGIVVGALNLWVLF